MGFSMPDLDSDGVILLATILSFNILIICLTAAYWIYASYGGNKGGSDTRGISRANRGSPLGRATSSDSVSSFANGGRSSSPIPSNGGSNRKRTTKYRIDEESLIESSFEFSPRGRLWSNRASWHLPNAPRDTILDDSYHGNIGLDHILAKLRTYSVDPDCGFLPPQDPLQRLPYARFHLWEDLADDLPSLLGARLGQAREPLTQLPVLPTHELASEPELRRAHLLLCLFAHAYVWGGSEPRDVIPEGIARPLCEVSTKLGLPPILGHTDIVLFNWRRLDVGADICMENLTTLNNFFHGRDESWFYLITVEIEARGAKTIVPLMLATDAIKRYKDKVATQKTLRSLERDSQSSASNSSIENETQSIDAEDNNDHGSFPPPFNSVQSSRHNGPLMGSLTADRVAPYVTGLLNSISESIESMVQSLKNMNEGCHPFIFYHRVRPFLSGWKHNPTLPTGVLYEGVSTDRQYYFGGSAAQSPLIPFLDIMLGISHNQSKSGGFLIAMRDYMTQGHREYLTYCEEIANIRQYVIDTLKESDLMVYTSKIDGVEDEEKEVIEGGSSETKGQEAKGGKPQRVETHTFIGVKGSAQVESLKYTEDLKVAYNKCVEALKNFRNGHMKLVADYIIAQQRPKGVDGATATTTKQSDEKNGGVADVKKGELQSSAGGKGTGGTDLMKFLKPIRDDCSKGILGDKGEMPSLTKERKGSNTSEVDAEDDEPEGASSGEEQSYTKDNALPEDLDVYRSPSPGSKKQELTYKLPKGATSWE